MVPDSVAVLGGEKRKDQEGRNLSCGVTAFAAGEEIADHTVNHFNGGVASVGPDPCCRPRKWNVEQWTKEIMAAKDMLVEKGGVGATPDDIIGFRAPYLSYTDALFDALATHGFLYDSTIPSCFGSDEDGSNCAWPYTLDAGSPDAVVMAKKFDFLRAARGRNSSSSRSCPPRSMGASADNPGRSTEQRGRAIWFRARTSERELRQHWVRVRRACTSQILARPLVWTTRS